MYCPKCGNKQNGEEKFCSKCGTKYPSSEEYKRVVPTAGEKMQQLFDKGKTTAENLAAKAKEQAEDLAAKTKEQAKVVAEQAQEKIEKGVETVKAKKEDFEAKHNETTPVEPAVETKESDNHENDLKQKQPEETSSEESKDCTDTQQNSETTETVSSEAKNPTIGWIVSFTAVILITYWITSGFWTFLISGVVCLFAWGAIMEYFKINPEKSPKLSGAIVVTFMLCGIVCCNGGSGTGNVGDSFLITDDLGHKFRIEITDKSDRGDLIFTVTDLGNNETGRATLTSIDEINFSRLGRLNKIWIGKTGIPWSCANSLYIRGGYIYHTFDAMRTNDPEMRLKLERE